MALYAMIGMGIQLVGIVLLVRELMTMTRAAPSDGRPVAASGVGRTDVDAAHLRRAPLQVAAAFLVTGLALQLLDTLIFG